MNLFLEEALPAFNPQPPAGVPISRSLCSRVCVAEQGAGEGSTGRHGTKRRLWHLSSAPIDNKQHKEKRCEIDMIIPAG